MKTLKDVQVGETVTAYTPTGERRFELLEISK